MALKLMRGVASRGYHLIEGVLGETLISGEAGENNPQEGIHWLRRAAERGAKDAQHSLAMTYLDGTCGNKDLAEASIWFRRAADQGYVYAQKELFRILYDGIDVVQDIPQALEWLRRAAEQNDEEAQYRLGLACYNGDGVPQDYVAASNWFQRAAENGSLEAQFNLGWMYTAGFGVIKDVEAGLRLYENAATQGLVDAQLRLSAIYDKGENVNEDKEEAEKWLRLAAQGGNLSARIALIHRYANKPLYDKNRLETDINEILKWCRAAAAQGHAESEENAKKIEIYLRDTYNKEVVDVKKQLNIELLRTIDVLDTQWSLGLSESEKSIRVQRMTNAFFPEEREESLPPAGFGGVPSQEAKGQATDIQQPAANKALLPQTWEEAKAQVPGLKKWSEVKAEAEKAGSTIIDHLRDTVHGYGHWATKPPGLPRHMLNKWDDHAAYEALYSRLRSHPLPPDLYLPAEKRGRKAIPLEDIPAVDSEEVRAARRLVRRADRAAERARGK